MNLLKKSILSFVTFLYINVTTAQTPDIYLDKANITTNINGTPVFKGDTVDLLVMYKENMSYTRTIYFDFQYNYKNFSILDVQTMPAGSTGSSIPQGATSSITNYQYNGYTYARNSQNYTRNGTQNYWACAYNYNVNNPNAIQRIYVAVTSNDGLRDGAFMKIRLKVNNVAAGTAYDSLYMNFAAAWRSDGAQIQTNMPDPMSSFITLDAAANTLITANVYKNPSVSLSFLIKDSATGNSIITVHPDINGVFKLSSELNSNTAYKIIPILDSAEKTLQNAITVSDATAVLNEFGSQNLDGTFNKTNLKTGAAWLAADVNFNGKLDGADPYLLLAHVAATDTISPVVYLFNRDIFSGDTLPVQQFVNFRTSTTNKQLNLNYLIAGDVNRSHSSQVVASDGTIKSFSLVNTPIQTKPSIGVSIATTIVNGDNIEIPITVDYGIGLVCGMQFEFTYDATKIQLQEVKSETSASWLNFFTNKNGVIKFGGIDKTLKEPLTGKGIPYVLKFKSIYAGVDLNTSIAVTGNMDASDNKGNQIGVNINTSSIRLIGINNFK